MYINVTEDDIARAIPADGAHCPIARAIRRELEPTYVFVSPDGIELIFQGKDDDGDPDSLTVDLPPSKPMADFMNAYDNDAPVQPTRFRLLGV